MSSRIFASILALVAAEVCELGELEALEPSCLLQTQWPPASLLTESGVASDPIPLCNNCWCDDTDEAAPVESGPEGFFNRCNDYCATFSRPLFETYQDDAFNPDNPTIECRCCRSTGRQDTSFPGHQVWQVVPTTTTTTTGANAAGVYGDPHIKTLDGKRYILLSQGTFSLWRYSGEAELPWKKVPVDWEVYTHYSGHQSFTKGLLLLDRSGGSPRQLLEITADDCQWWARKGAAEWTAVQDEETVALPEGNDYISGFVVNKKNGPNGHNHVRLNMQTKDGKADIAVLSLSCRPKHHLNVQMIMKRTSDVQFVHGQLKPARKVSFSLQQSTDSEFVLNSTWQDMGGSAQAAAYLQSVDEMQEPNPSLLSTCSSADEDQARQTCFKHLGHVDHGNADEAAFLNDCIFDVCHGAGETAAELAAELRASTQAI